MILGNRKKGAAKPWMLDASTSASKYGGVQAAQGLRLAYLKNKDSLQAKMEMEQRNSRVNRLKIQNQWRKTMRLAKVDGLRKDIEILSQVRRRTGGGTEHTFVCSFSLLFFSVCPGFFFIFHHYYRHVFVRSSLPCQPPN